MTILRVVFSVFVMVASLHSAPPPACAQKDLSTELQKGQAALAGGDYEKAFREYLRVAEEKNNPLAQFGLALFYTNGWGRKPDAKAACGWYAKAANGGIPAAMHFHAECLVSGMAGQPKPEEAAKWYRQAGDVGHFISYCDLADLYMTGNGVAKDPQKAIALCLQAAEKHSAPAQLKLGFLYLKGDLSVRDVDQAYRWFEAAAQLNSVDAQMQLAKMNQDGIGRPRSTEAARFWYETAASQGCVAAYLPTAELYFNPPKDSGADPIPAEALAKAYLWSTAARNRCTAEDELDRANGLLERILAIMPATWNEPLDEKVDHHLKEKPALCLPEG